MTDHRNFLAMSALFSGMPAALLENLSRHASTRTLSRGAMIFHEGDAGDCCYGVMAGTVRIFAQGSSGKRLTYCELVSGEFFGEIAMLDGGARSASAQAMTACTLLSLHRSAMLDAMSHHPALARRVISLLCQRTRFSSELFVDASLLALPGRLAKRLLQELEHRAETGHSEIRLSQQELATMIGATREAVNRQLMAWQNQGLVQLRRGVLRIPLPERLAQVLTGSDLA